jgi:hypothetical protein
VCLRMSRGDAGCMMLYGGVTLRTSTIWKNIVTSSDLMIFEWWAKCRNPQNLSCNHLGGVYCVIGPILRYPLPLSLLGGFACALSKLQPSSNPQSRCGAVPLSKSLPKKEDFLCGILAVQKMWIDLGWFQHVSTRFNTFQPSILDAKSPPSLQWLEAYPGIAELPGFGWNSAPLRFHECPRFAGYPLVNWHITMDNHHFSWENPL